MSNQRDLNSLLRMDTVLFGNLENRAMFPTRVRQLVESGAVEVTLTMSAETALNMADDIEFAVACHPHGVPKS